MSISPLQCSSCSVHPALCTLHCELVELSDHFMTTFALHCAVKFDAQESILSQYPGEILPCMYSVHCSMLYTFCTLNGLRCQSTLCLSAAVSMCRRLYYAFLLLSVCYSLVLQSTFSPFSLLKEHREESLKAFLLSMC